MIKPRMTSERVTVTLTVENWLYMLAFIELNGSDMMPSIISDSIYDALNK